MTVSAPSSHGSARLLADALIGVGLLGAIVAAGIAALLGGGPAVAGKPVLVIAPPWGNGAAAIVRSAGGTPATPVDAAFGTLAMFETAVPVGRLHALGAWSVRDGAVVARICGVD